MKTYPDSTPESGSAKTASLGRMKSNPMMSQKIKGRNDQMGLGSPGNCKGRMDQTPNV